MSELQARAARAGHSLKEEANLCLARALGLDPRAESPWSARTFAMGGATAELGRAWELVDALEEEAYAAKRELRT